MQAVPVAPSYSVSDLTTFIGILWFSSLLPFLVAVSSRASCMSPAWVMEVTMGNCLLNYLAPKSCFRIFLILSSCPGILEFGET